MVEIRAHPNSALRRRSGTDQSLEALLACSSRFPLSLLLRVGHPAASANRALCATRTSRPFLQLGGSQVLHLARRRAWLRFHSLVLRWSRQGDGIPLPHHYLPRRRLWLPFRRLAGIGGPKSRMPYSEDRRQDPVSGSGFLKSPHPIRGGVEIRGRGLYPGDDDFVRNAGLQQIDDVLVGKRLLEVNDGAFLGRSGERQGGVA
jgi:hypothetical protein